MERAGIRRRRAVALVLLLGFAAGAFALGATLGDGAAPDPQVPERSQQAPMTASLLPPRHLVGERILTGLEGTEISQRLRRAIHRGAIAGVVLFAGNFPSRADGRRLIAELQAIRRPPHLRVPLLIMVDQEGGQVKRVDGAPAVSAAQM